MAITVGQKAPAFSAKDQTGATVSLSDFGGKYVVLYFYPKDNTPGCTVEACSFRDDFAHFKKAGGVVIGVSPDSEKSHQGFIAKHQLPFQLLVDADHAVASRYGAWGEKSLYGRKFMGIIRSTFLIAPDGTVAAAWPKVKVDGHSEDVLAAIEAHQSGDAASAKKPVKKAAPAKKAAPKKKR
jgi:peroxiredoxin Q/BCP